MATIQELEQKIQRLERDILAKDQKDAILIEKAEKAIDFAMHAYRIDHYGWVWVWDVDTQGYRRSKICIHNIDVPDGSITGKKIAERTIEGRHILAGAIRNEHIGDKAVSNRTLADNAVDTTNIKDGAVTPSKVSNNFINKLVQPMIDALRRKHDADILRLDRKDADLQNQIDSFNDHGMSVSNELGDNPHIGVSQKTLTDIINNMLAKICEVTGEEYAGIYMQVTPKYYIGEEGCNVHIHATTVDTNGIFERINFFWNAEEEPFYSEVQCVGIDDLVVDLPEDKLINDEIVIRCEAQILGIKYMAQDKIKHYNSLFLFAASDEELGEDFANISNFLIPENTISAAHHMRGAYNLNMADGQRIVMVMGDSLAGGFIRADINGIEIQFNTDDLDVEGTAYKVLTSEDTYQEDAINIDING